MAAAGVTVDLVAYLNDGKSRKANDGKKLWRNADKLAALIVDSAANAFQCESSASMAENGYENMAQAVDGYISSNLDSWSQVELEDCRSFWDVDQLARLAEMVQREAAHAEALEMDKQATHFRREQAALSDRVRKIMGKPTTTTTTTEGNTVNKAKAKQQQNPATLPKPQMVDVLRAVLRMQGEATDAQISAVAAMTETAMRKTITAIINKGARVTAHLVKSKRYGYGALTFGIEGQLPPGAYHALPVKNMKDARNVASQYGALMWNF